MFPENLKTTGGLSILMHGIISLPDGMSYDKNHVLLIKCSASLTFYIFTTTCLINSVIYCK